MEYQPYLVAFGCKAGGRMSQVRGNNEVACFPVCGVFA